MPIDARTPSLLRRSARTTLLAAALMVGGGTLATVGGCASSGVAMGPVTIDAASPESLLASLKSAAGQSFNRYLEALRSATDCERLPDFCRLLEAREDAAKEIEKEEAEGEEAAGGGKGKKGNKKGQSKKASQKKKADKKKED